MIKTFTDHGPFRKLSFKEHAEAIGYVCRIWAQTEYVLGTIIASLMGMEGTPHSDILVSSMDMRRRVETLKAIAFLQKKDEEWFSRLETALNSLDNDIRPRRNRIVHDAWIEKVPTPSQVRTMARVVKDGPFKKIVKHRDAREIPVDEIWKLYKDITKSLADISQLWFEHPCSKIK